MYSMIHILTYMYSTCTVYKVLVALPTVNYKNCTVCIAVLVSAELDTAYQLA